MKTVRAQLRQRAGFTLRTLSNASKVSISRLSAFENGEIRLRQEEIATIATLLRKGLNEAPHLKTAVEIFEFLNSEGTKHARVAL
jgi:transcriptional regulator with XRE-family HTH domain